MARPRTSRGRAREISRRLEEEYPEAHTALLHEDAWQLLVATILSAQCTDERVNQVTPGLFRRYPDPAAFAAAPLTDLEEAVKPTGFFRNKSRSIQGAAQAVVERFGGRVPRSMEELVTIPGVGRKTANVILHAAFGIPGIAVDTHVGRLSRRLGLSEHDDPEKVERDLMSLLPEDRWGHFSMALILHGRRVCTARKPACDRCLLADVCPSAFVVAGAPPRPAGRRAGT